METELCHTVTDTAHCPAEGQNWEKEANRRMTCRGLVMPALGSCCSLMTLWRQHLKQQSCLCIS